jgi:hypothetical protein
MDIHELRLPNGKDIDSTVLKYGVHLATRNTLFCTIALFQIENDYVEVFYDAKTKEIGRMRVFDDTEELAPYLKKIDISGLFA